MKFSSEAQDMLICDGKVENGRYQNRRYGIRNGTGLKNAQRFCLHWNPSDRRAKLSTCSLSKECIREKQAGRDIKPDSPVVLESNWLNDETKQRGKPYFNVFCYPCLQFFALHSFEYTQLPD